MEIPCGGLDALFLEGVLAAAPHPRAMLAPRERERWAFGNVGGWGTAGWSWETPGIVIVGFWYY
eukprot:3676855-Prymnesium_polylepis.2